MGGCGAALSCQMAAGGNGGGKKLACPWDLEGAGTAPTLPEVALALRPLRMAVPRAVA